MPGPTIIPRLRWWIGGMLFASTVINYIDRQTLSVLGPTLKIEFNWNNSDFAWVLIAFRLAYAVMQMITGRMLDWLGTRTGLTLAVLWYSCAAMLTSLAGGLKSFALFRFLLGTGEAANWPGATKAVSEWFPRQERGWAVALFDSGSAVGAAVAPVLVLWLHQTTGSWRPVFLITGSLGLIWVLLWRRLYHPPETHPNLGPAEKGMILAGRGTPGEMTGPSSWKGLLGMRETWGIVLGRSLTDPVWFFITDWFAIYLVSKGFKLETALFAFWLPFLAAELGNFAGGGTSSRLINAGWSVRKARRAVIIVCGVAMTSLGWAAFTSNLWVLVMLFAIATFSYAAWSTMALTLPSDLYESSRVASVSGLSGTGAGLGTVLSTYLIGRVSDRLSFGPVLVAGSVIPLLATVLVCRLSLADRGREIAHR
jgi:ACS family hexuronate transporter-like MFS transporter